MEQRVETLMETHWQHSGSARAAYLLLLVALCADTCRPIHRGDAQTEKQKGSDQIRLSFKTECFLLFFADFNFLKENWFLQIEKLCS